MMVSKSSLMNLVASEKLEKAGNVDCKNTRTEGEDKVQAVSTQGSRQVLPFLAPKSQNL